MIPTVVIVKDESPFLVSLGGVLERICRVVYRDSFQGEQLYGIFEGALYFDHTGARQIVRKDEYEDFVEKVLLQLRNMDLKTQALLRHYLDQRGANTLLPKLLPPGVMSNLAVEEYYKYIDKIYAKK